LNENPTGQALADLIHKEQKILAKEVRWLQDKAWKARKRASERREHRNKNQNSLLKRISLLTAALTETVPLQPKDKIKRATRKAMQGLGFLHLQHTFQKLIRQHDRWKALLRVEIGKAERLMEKENLKQNRRDNRRDIGKKNEIFKHGIKGIKKITGKYNTSKPLTEVKISCPCGLKWK
jgi:acyl-CoA reductase-like NAD-dependent aldehyde dehydrogenase